VGLQTIHYGLVSNKGAEAAVEAGIPGFLFTEAYSGSLLAGSASRAALASMRRCQSGFLDSTATMCLIWSAG